jgi:hypothetical protein
MHSKERPWEKNSLIRNEREKQQEATEDSGLHHKLQRSRFGNNNHAKFTFHRFVWNRHKCHSSTCIVWTLMSCALFRHESDMPIDIVYTQMFYVYSCCLYMKIMHTILMFK